MRELKEPLKNHGAIKCQRRKRDAARLAGETGDTAEKRVAIRATDVRSSAFIGNVSYGDYDATVDVINGEDVLIEGNVNIRRKPST